MYGYIGPSAVLAANIENTIYYALKEGEVSRTDYSKEFEREIRIRAGEPYNALSISMQEKYAKQILVNESISHPREMFIFFVKNFLKHIFAPIESVVQKLILLYTSDKIYFTYVRPVLGLMCLAVWLFSLIPPISLENRQLLYYFFTMMFLLYVIGISVITQFQGERIRFPVLAFMLPVMVWNVHHVYGYLRGWGEYRHSNHITFSDCKPG